MVERVRPVAQGGNVTDELRMRALADLTARDRVIGDAAEELKSLKAQRSAQIKHYKGLGMRTDPLRRVARERFKEPVDVLADLHEETRLRALSNMPTIQEDLVDLLGVPLDIDAEQRTQIQRDRWRDDGAFAAREKHTRESNPHEAGSEAHQQWDMGWLHNQERIAAAMGAGEPPVVDTGRKRPAAKKKAAAPKEPRKAPPRRRHEPEVEARMGSGLSDDA
jgi:hypothetical protein